MPTWRLNLFNSFTHILSLFLLVYKSIHDFASNNHLSLWLSLSSSELSSAYTNPGGTWASSSCWRSRARAHVLLHDISLRIHTTLARAPLLQQVFLTLNLPIQDSFRYIQSWSFSFQTRKTIPFAFYNFYLVESRENTEFSDWFATLQEIIKLRG